MPISNRKCSSREIPDKAEGAEAILLDELKTGLDALASDQGKVMLKLTLPDVPDLYKAPLIADDRVIRVVAFQAAIPEPTPARRLRDNHGMIASFSRALLEELKRGAMSDAEFNAGLARPSTRSTRHPP